MLISVEQAWALIDAEVQSLPIESVTLSDSVGRTLVSEISSDVDSPPHRKSMMDGFAVRSADIVRDGVELNVVETVVAGDVPTRLVESGQATRIMTGAPMPAGADAVVMVELTEYSEEDQTVRIMLPELAPRKHTAEQGSNFRCGEILFSSGRRVRPIDVGLLAEIGAAQLDVVRQPRVAILPTGDELVDCEQLPDAGQIRNSNGPMLAAMMTALDCEVQPLGIGRDDRESLAEKIDRGLQADLLLLSGGVSAGTMDLVPELLAHAGVQQVFHKVAVKPGKPIWFGVRRSGDAVCYVFGLPGNPVSSMVGVRLFVQRLLRGLAGRNAADRSARVQISRDHETRGDRPSYWPGQIVASENSATQVLPLDWRGSSDLRSLAVADGLIVFPPGTQVHPAGSEFEFLPL